MRLSLLAGCCYDFGGWIEDGRGRWIGQWTGESSTAHPDFYALAAVSPDGEFFVVTGDDIGLPPDYAIVGEVTEGLDVVERIGALGDPATEQPLQPVVIRSVTAASTP